MDRDTSQQQLLLNSSIHTTNETINEETPFIDPPSDEEEEEEEEQTESSIIEDWNTSKVSQVCREGDLVYMRAFSEYSKQTASCCADASKIADRLDLETGLSPLHHAARYQQLHICLMLLSHLNFQSGVNIKDADDRTPIHSAFRSSNNSNQNKSNPEKPFNIKKDFGNKIQDEKAWKKEYKTKILTSDHPLIYLFSRVNGDLNARDKYLLTPLHYAVARNNLAGVKQLITLNVDIESEDRQKIRPLHLGCKEGYQLIVEYLIEHRANLYPMDADNWTPLHHACAKGHLDIVKLIKSKDERKFEKFIQMKTNTKASCIHLAVQNGNIDLIKYIFSIFDDDTLKKLINEEAEPFGTTLHIAAKFCGQEMIEILYDHGADPSVLNSFNQSPLHIASSLDRFSIIKKLLSLTQSTLLEIKDKRGHTALSLTTNTDIINELLRFKADISSVNRNHMNVLMIAVSKNQISIVEHLLYVIDSSLNKKLFDQVTKRNNRSIFLLAVETGSIPLCELLLSNEYIRWDTIDRQRMNAFHIAARNNHYELIEFLCNYIQKSDKNFNYTDSDLFNFPQKFSNLRVYLDAQNDDGKTPLHFAAEYGHTLSVEILLKYGADILLTNYLGQLALHTAIQTDHCQCVDLLIRNSVRNLADFQSVLSRKQSPLIMACQNGSIDIVRLLISQDIRTDYNYEEGENPLEIAIKYRQIEVLHELLEHPQTEHWLMPIRETEKSFHQTPLRDMIRSIPECAKHTFDKFIIKTTDTDSKGDTIEKTTYNYKYIDDYFTNDDELYVQTSRKLYRNHPFIIALDSEHYSLLEHPLAQQLISRKWKLYRSFFYLFLILTFLLLTILTFYVLIIPAPNLKKSSKKILIPFIEKLLIPIRWIIVILAGINFAKIILEIFLYRGLRVPFAQLFGIIAFLTPIVAFIPYKNTNELTNQQWQLAALSVLFQWFNIALILRSVPSIGKVIIMFQSILVKFTSLVFVILPLLIAFMISTHMIFYNHSAFLGILFSVRKLSAMLIGEFDYETLFHSKPTFTIASVIFISFIVIMAIVFMNLLLGLTVGDIQICLENAEAKANAYRIRELIYMECTLPSTSKLRKNTTDQESIERSLKDLILSKTNEDDEDYNETILNRQRFSEFNKLLEILNMLNKQAKQVLEKEIYFERLLNRLLASRQAHSSIID